MALYSEIDGLQLDELIARFHSSCPDDDPGLWYEEVGYYIGQQGPDGVEFLLSHAAEADEHRLRGILLGASTATPRDPAVRALLRQSLADDRPFVLQNAIDGLAFIRDTEVHGSILSFLDHPLPYVVGAALRYLARLFPTEARPILLASLSDSRPVVRENAVDELDEMDDPGADEVAPHIFPLLADPDWGVRQAAQTFLQHWWWDDGHRDPAEHLAAVEPFLRASAIYRTIDRDKVLATPILLTALDDPAQVVRVAGLDSIANQSWAPAKFPEAVVARIDSLRFNPDSLVVQAAARVMEYWQGGRSGMSIESSGHDMNDENRKDPYDRVEDRVDGPTDVGGEISTSTLYRPVGPKELALIRESGFRAFPPRLPVQPIFYPVLNEEYAAQIASTWNVRDSGAGFVTRFHVRTEFLVRYQVQTVGARMHQELWVPAEELEEFNANIVGPIEVIAEFTRSDENEEPAAQ